MAMARAMARAGALYSRKIREKSRTLFQDVLMKNNKRVLTVETS